MTERRPNFDRVRMGCAVTGRLYEVVDPRWWDLPRWLVWLCRAKGRVQFTLYGHLFDVRVRFLPYTPPTVLVVERKVAALSDEQRRNLADRKPHNRSLN